MSDLFKYVAPLIGTKGEYTLIAPFTVSEGEVLECIASRTLADWVVNNDDALTDIYLKYGLTEVNYDEDLAAKMEIVSLRNDRGFIYHIPAKYIASYPVQDGIQYHTVALVVALPAMRIEEDFSVTINEISQVVSSNLGTKCTVNVVETSHIRAIPATEDAVIQGERDIVKGDTAMVYAQLSQAHNEIDSLKAKIAILEGYIREHP